MGLELLIQLGAVVLRTARDPGPGGATAAQVPRAAPMALITALSALDTSTQLLIYGLLTVHVGALVFWAYMCSRPQVRHADKLE